MSKTVAIDFDGVLHPYTEGWVGSVPADEEPMDGAIAFVRLLVAEGFVPIVFSVRADHTEGMVGICDWMNKHGFPATAPADPDLDRGYRIVSDWGQDLGATQIKVTWVKPPAIAYVDDRAVSFHYDSSHESARSGFIRAMGGVRRLAIDGSWTGPDKPPVAAPAPGSVG